MYLLTLLIEYIWNIIIDLVLMGSPSIVVALYLEDAAKGFLLKASGACQDPVVKLCLISLILMYFATKKKGFDSP